MRTGSTLMLVRAHTRAHTHSHLQVVLVTSESSKSGTFFFFGGNNNTPNKDLTRTEKLVRSCTARCMRTQLALGLLCEAAPEERVCV